MAHRTTYYSDPFICIVCEKEYFAYSRKTMYCSKYCADEGRRRGIKQQPRTKSAICLGCGEEFTRPESYQSAMHYCSNKCSHSERKRVRDRYVLTLHEDAIVFRSTWELRFVAACFRFNLPWRRYDGELLITSEGNYRPDFIAGIEEYVIEIKGRMDEVSVVKIEAGKQAFGDKYKVILEDDLIQFEETGELDVKIDSTRSSGWMV